MADKTENEKLYKVTEAAAMLGASRHSVGVWLRQGRFPNAHKVETAIGDYWLIPESDVKNVKIYKRGRPKKEPSPDLCVCGREK